MSRWVPQLGCCPHIHAGEPRLGVGFLIFPQVDRLVPSAEMQSERNFGNQKRGNPFLATLLDKKKEKNMKGENGAEYGALGK